MVTLGLGHVASGREFRQEPEARPFEAMSVMSHILTAACDTRCPGCLSVALNYAVVVQVAVARCLRALRILLRYVVTGVGVTHDCCPAPSPSPR